MADEQRITDLFIKLTGFDCETFNEKKIGHFLTDKLEALGLEVSTNNTTEPEYLLSHPNSYPNIYAFLKGNIPGEPILVSAHLDTVSPGVGKKALISKDGRITSEGDTVLGADDISGIVAIIEALTVIRETGADHKDIEVLLTVSEEAFCEGSKYFNYDLIRSKTAYVLDLTGKIGTAALSAPSIISFTADISGRASHAGFAPEEGINALKAATNAITHIKTGKINHSTTVNIGTITSGLANNIVPGSARLTGEIRSLDHNKALAQAQKVENIIRRYVREAGATLDFSKTEHIKAYRVRKRQDVTGRFIKACKKTGVEPEFITTLGGSDANRLNAAGIAAVVNSCGMEKSHSTDEYTYVSDLVRSAQLTLNLMTV